MVSWNWNEEASSSGTVHQSVANTDHNDATLLKQGYSATNPYSPTPPGGVYLCHEDSGTTVYDYSGNNRDGTANGATPNQDGLLGATGWQFDGTDDLFNLGDYDDWSLWTNGGTAIIWFKVPSNVDADSLDDYALYKDSEWAFHPYDQGGTAGEFTPRVDVFGDNNLEEVTDSLGTGVWHHWAVDFRPSSDEFETVVNGSSVGITPSTDSSSNTSSTLWVGGDGANNGQYLPMYCGGVWIYPSGLSVSEIQTHYNIVRGTGTWTGTQKLV